MTNQQMWRAILAAKKVFHDRYDYNEFTDLYGKLNRKSDSIRMSADREVARTAFDQNVSDFSWHDAGTLVHAVHELLSSLESQHLIDVSVYKEIPVNPKSVQDYLASHHIIDDSCDSEKVIPSYSLDINNRINLTEPKFPGMTHDWISNCLATARARDSVISTSLGFVLDRLDDAIELQSKNCIMQHKHGGCPDLVEIRRGNKTLFEIPLKFGLFKLRESGDTAVPEFDKMTVRDATLKDIKVLESQLTTAQARRARGQLLGNDLGM